LQKCGRGGEGDEKGAQDEDEGHCTEKGTHWEGCRGRRCSRSSRWGHGGTEGRTRRRSRRLAELESLAAVGCGEVAEADEGAEGEGDFPFDRLALAEARGDVGGGEGARGRGKNGEDGGGAAALVSGEGGLALVGGGDEIELALFGLLRGGAEAGALASTGNEWVGPPPARQDP
jgi:hypothetical protein